MAEGKPKRSCSGQASLMSLCPSTQTHSKACSINVGQQEGTCCASDAWAHHNLRIQNSSSRIPKLLILLSKRLCVHIHMNTHTYIYIYMYVDMLITYTHTYTYIYIHIHTYTYIYIHIHTYTYIYIHIHTYTYISYTQLTHRNTESPEGKSPYSCSSSKTVCPPPPLLDPGQSHQLHVPCGASTR